MQKSRKRLRLERIFIFFSIIAVLFASSFILFNKISNTKNSKVELTEKPKAEEKAVIASDDTNLNTRKDTSLSAPVFTEVTINSVGDCTIGNDDKFAYESSLPAMLHSQNSDYSYFFKNVVDIFKNDDITTANLETTFTNATTKADKQFTFKAEPEYAKILLLGSIEGVNLSNNHIFDYLKKGYEDTIVSLKNEKINYFGEGNKWITVAQGHKFGFLGYRAFYYDTSFLRTLENDIHQLKKEGCTVIINFHWGEENAYSPNATQKYIGHYAIDKGADLIIGHHPHVIDGIEKYKNKFIAYSLGNFCFGGNSNPVDKDTFILQSKFKFKENQLISLGIKPIPCSISSVGYRNDYCPTPSIGDKKNEILNKLNTLSNAFGATITDDFVYTNLEEQN